MTIGQGPDLCLLDPAGGWAKFASEVDSNEHEVTSSGISDPCGTDDVPTQSANDQPTPTPQVDSLGGYILLGEVQISKDGLDDIDAMFRVRNDTAGPLGNDCNVTVLNGDEIWASMASLAAAREVAPR